MDNNYYNYGTNNSNNYGADDPRRRLFMAVGIIIAVLILLGVVLTIATSGSHTGNDANKRNTDITAINSALTKSSDQLAVTYGSDVNPDMDAVKQPFRIFALDSLPLPSNVKKALSELLPAALLQHITPTYPSTYIQIVKDSISCDSTNTCSMSLYIDSPETYFNLKLAHTGTGGYTAELTQEPWQGVPQ